MRPNAPNPTPPSGPVPAPPSPRRRARRHAIVAAAEELLRRRGMEELSMQAIAGELGYSAGALYRYFPSKDALLAAVQLAAIEDLTGDLRAAVRAARGSGDPLAGILAVAAGYIAFSRTDPDRFALLTQSIADPRQLVDAAEAAAVVDAGLEALDLLAGRLDAAATAGALEEGHAGERATALWTAMQGALQLAKIARLRPAAFPAERLAWTGVRGLLTGWGATAAALDGAAGALAATLPDLAAAARLDASNAPATPSLDAPISKGASQ